MLSTGRRAVEPRGTSAEFHRLHHLVILQAIVASEPLEVSGLRGRCTRRLLLSSLKCRNRLIGRIIGDFIGLRGICDGALRGNRLLVDNGSILLGNDWISRDGVWLLSGLHGLVALLLGRLLQHLSVGSRLTEVGLGRRFNWRLGLLGGLFA